MAFSPLFRQEPVIWFETFFFSLEHIVVRDLAKCSRMAGGQSVKMFVPHLTKGRERVSRVAAVRTFWPWWRSLVVFLFFIFGL